MPLPSKKMDPVRLSLIVMISAVHVGAIYGLMQLSARPSVQAESRPVAVRLISESVHRPDWQPPKVTPVLPAVLTPPPVVPMIEIPVAAPESSHAISVPVAVAQATPRPTQQADVAKLVAAVEYLREPAPHYPPQSRKLREQGLVVLRVLIDERGNAADVVIENSSGHERLDRAAREAIARAAFRPYVEDGIARRAQVLIPIEFSLNRTTRVAANGA